MIRYLLSMFLSAVIFLPLGLLLQWWLPNDGPYEVIVLFLSLPLIAMVLCLYLLAKKSSSANLLRFAAFGLVTFFLWIQVFTFIPQISRRVGPWREIRKLLIEKEQQVATLSASLGIPEGRPFTAEESRKIESLILYPPAAYEFPFLHKQVRLRLLLSVPPYVGLDYGGGRNCAFDLRNMARIYCD